MRRIVVVVTLVAGCGAPAPAHVVVPTVAATPARRLEVSPSRPAESEPAPFDIVMGTTSLCVLSNGAAHCPHDIAADEPLANGPILDGLTNVRGLSFGQDFHCAVTADGKVACGGGNHFGQLGAGVAEESAGLKVLPALSHVKRVVSGPFTSCAILDDGTLSCWGKNESGESGSATNVLPDARVVVEPELVAGIRDVTEVALAWGASCAAMANGDVACWGTADLPEHKKLRGAQDERPTVIPSLAGATSLSANEQTFCAVLKGKVVCWGSRSMLLSRGGSPALTELAIPDAQRVSLGRSHGCAIGGAGDVYCFGAAYSGALGVAVSDRDYQPRGPAKVAGLPRVERVACGASLSCALTAGHELYCWGRFGTHTSDIAPTPVQMRVLPNR